MQPNKSTFKNILAHNIKVFRKKAGLTQQHAADAIYCSLKTYQKIENAACSLDLNTIYLLTEAFCISVFELLTNILYPAPFPKTDAPPGKQNR